MNEPKPLALVTGASSGIGFELAKQFAEHGFDLVLTAENAGLAVAADEMRSHGAYVLTVKTDLATEEGTEMLLGAITATGRPLAAAALNAGVGRGGAFLDTDVADEVRVIDLNVTSTVRLAKGLLPGMVARGEGRLLFTSSIAAAVPGSFQAVYNASKSFVQSFAQALRNELKGTGVTVTAVMPGATETPFFRRAGMDDTRVGRQKKDDPEEVARQGFEALMTGRKKIVAGSVKTKAQGLANRILPDSVKAAAHRKMAEPGSGESK
ncbi:oxidoreductase [Streptomyces agglomeratus]|uniref:SDR family NAD(P)-dependent oxidoreductase n=1 Tax=Streptomyces agglomeratus TaxID=285458 RepID=UPI000854DE77|nr:SDR family NAD(P)-dependent oxidoreductase [Streptomyces agglomeratus]OEJ37701.1 oxidoreductase [Streptomyces agglomeratus]OEJ47913.1 oxidoreductase [Streptomyces agglomeratus]OEJ50241.1 oxidoreductase [Streptomyces agglomeratus]OEJ57569.1 oxidoreductase [Streptomyces agglomeratus]